MQYRSLADVPFAVIHTAFCAAFSDYSQPMTLSIADLHTMFETRSGDLTHSFGAFDEQTLVGFVLVGARTIAGRSVGYDIATGVLPAYRGRGIATALITATLEDLATHGFDSFQLEVIDTNVPAIRLYRRLGFAESRRLSCFRTSRDESSLHFPWAVVPHIGDINEVALNGYQPSWQQSLVSFLQQPDAYVVVGQSDTAGAVLGYGIVNPTTGSIMQLALHERIRTANLLDALLAAVCAVSSGEHLRIVNVEAGSWLAEQLTLRGWELFVAQYEMQKRLKVKG